MSAHSDKNILVERHFERSCFIVFSSREPHIESVLNRVCDLLTNELGVRPIRLDEARQPGEILQTQLLETMRSCNFGIVFLDGFRPNVIFELGLLIAFDIPRLILLERSSTVNLASLLKDVGLKSKTPKLKIDVQKHLSDLSNIGITYYSAANDLEFRPLIRKDIKKLIARTAKGGGDDLEYKLAAKLDSSGKLPDRRFEALLETVADARPKLKDSQAAHVMMHLSRALCRRNDRSLALRLVTAELKRTRSSALIAEHAYILLEMGQAPDAFREIDKAFRRAPKDMTLLRAYCVLAIRNGLPQSALKALKGLSYEILVLSDLIRVKAHALFLSGKRSESVSLLLDLYQRNRSQPALGQAIQLIGESVNAHLSEELTHRLEYVIALAEKKKDIPCKECLGEAAIVLGSRDLIARYPKVHPVPDSLDAVERINEAAYDLIQSKKFKKAKAIIDSALKKFPKHAYLHATQGMYFLNAENDLPKGMRKYDDAVKLAPNDGPLKRMRLYQIGRYHLGTGHRQKALQCFRAALKTPSTGRANFLASELSALLSLSASGQRIDP